MSTPESAPPPASSPPETALPQQYFLLLFQIGDEKDAYSFLGPSVCQHVRRHLDRVVTSPRDDTEIDIWIDSPGGDAHAAYKLSLELRGRAKKLRAVIPDFAKSAATLLALGSDEIWMARSAELGPLDAQIGHPDREGLRVSALDVSNALGFLAEIALRYLIVGGGKVIQATRLPRVNVLERMAEFSATFFRPVVEKLDPHLIHQATQELEVARRYAEDLLCTTGDEKCDRSELARILVQEYPSHGFVISRHEAKSIGLPVFRAEEYTFWGAARAILDAFERGKFGTHLVRVVSLSTLEELTNSHPPQAKGLSGDDEQDEESVASGDADTASAT